MLSNGAAIRLTDSASATYDFLLDPNIDGSWDHRFDPLLANKQVGSGLPGVQNLISWKLPWRMTDWSGGENARYYRPGDPTQYDYATSGNPRLPGTLRGTPTKTSGSYTPDALPARAWMALADGVAWIVADRVDNSAITNVAAKSSDGSTWTTVAIASKGVHYLFTAVAGDNSHLYYATANTGSDVSVYRVKADASDNVEVVFMSSGPPIESGPIKAMALSGPYLYTLSLGGKLRQFDTTASASFPYATGTRIITLPDLTAAGTNVVMVKGDTSIFIMISRSGNTEVYELTAPDTSNAVCSLIWGGANSALQGFTGTALGYGDSVVYLAGYFGNGTTNRACLYGKPIDSSTADLIAKIRVENATTSSLEPRWISPGEAGEVIVVCKTGETFLYNKSMDSLTLLDTEASFAAADACASFAGKRIVLFRKTSDSTLRTAAWSDDYATTTSGFDLFSPTWEFDLPYLKVLTAVNVEYKPITGSETIVIKYQLDESGSYTALTTINSGSTGAAQGRTVLTGSTVASMKKFRKISFEAVGTGGAELRDCTPVAELAEDVEVIDAALWIVDETQIGRPRDNQKSAQALLNLFYDPTTGLKRAQNFLTLTNGAESPVPGSTTSHVVRVADCRFVPRTENTDKNTGLEGTLYVRLIVEP